MSLRSALGLFSAIAPNDHQQQEETDAVHPNGSQSFCHQRHPARHVLANPTLSGHQNQDCPTLSDDHWVCASLLSSNVITKQKRVYLKHCHQCNCNPFSQVLMLAIKLNWGQHLQGNFRLCNIVRVSGYSAAKQSGKHYETTTLRPQCLVLQIWKRILHNLWFFYYMFLGVEWGGGLRPKFPYIHFICELETNPATRKDTEALYLWSQSGSHHRFNFEASLLPP